MDFRQPKTYIKIAIYIPSYFDLHYIVLEYLHLATQSFHLVQFLVVYHEPDAAHILPTSIQIFHEALNDLLCLVTLAH